MRSTRPVGDNRLRVRLQLCLATLLLTQLPACAASLPSAAPPQSLQPPASGVTAPPNRIVHRGKPLYLSGFNIAWFDFASDVGKGIDEARLRQAASDLAEAGGNTLRWWIHTDPSR